MEEKTHDDLRNAFDDGSILNATKSELEQYLLANGRTRINRPDNQAKAHEMGETLRQLLAARQSQEMHSQALNISRVALIVSIIAMLFTASQLILQSGLLQAQPETSLENSAPVIQQSQIEQGK